MTNLSALIPPTGVITADQTVTLTNKSVTDLVFIAGYQEATSSPSWTGTVALNTDGGTSLDVTLTGNTTLTDGLVNGESVSLLIDDGTGYTLTMPAGTWVNNAGVPPDNLNATGPTGITIHKVGGALYYWLTGDGA